MPNLDWPSTPDCQVVFEMFASSRGSVSLGRLNGGREAGRLVLLNDVPASAVPQTRREAAFFSAISQPKLLKVVGLVSDERRYYVASEYIPGVSLYELIDAARSRQRPLATAAAVRIVADALALVGAGRALLQDNARPLVRLFHADSIWVAEFGETLLATAGIAGSLAASSLVNGDEPLTDEDDDRDSLPAALALFQLASGQLLVGDACAAARAHLPGPLAEELVEVFSGGFGSGLGATTHFAAALARLGPSLVGTEALVAEELRALVGELLDERKRRVAALKDASNSPSVEDPTRVYSAMLPDGGGAEEETIALRNQPFESQPLVRALPAEPIAPRVQSQFEALVPKRTRPHRSASPAQRPAPVAVASPLPTPRPRVRRRWRRRVTVFFLLLAVVAALGFAEPAWWRRTVSHVRAMLATYGIRV